MANLITWTALPGGRHDAASARTRVSMFIALRIEDPPACAEASDWPATLAGLRFRAIVEGASPAEFSESAGTLARVTGVAPSSAAWKLGLGHTTTRSAGRSVASRRAAAAAFATKGHVLSYDSQQIAAALRDLYRETVRGQAEGLRSGRSPAGSLTKAESAGARSAVERFANADSLRNFEEFYRPVTRTPPPPEPGPFDFNQTLAILGQHPHLMRLFGVAVDFELALSPQALPAQGRVRIAPVVPPGCPNSSLWTAFESVSINGNVLFTARPRDPTRHRSGLVLLGAGSGLGVVQEDVEGSTMKLRSMARQLALGKGRASDDTSNELPAQRTVGLTLLHTGRASQLVAASQRALIALESAVNASKSAGVADETLFLEDVCRAVRPDARREDVSFLSLCSRQVDFRIGEGDHAIRASGVEDEGSVAMTTAQPDDQVRLHEAVFRYDGFGLAVERPFKTADEEAVGLEDPKELKIEAVSRPIKGSLPPLRYGSRYRFAIRAVDVAGGGLTLEDTRRLLEGPSPAFPDAVSEPIFFVRREPIGSPLLVPTRELEPGESDNIIAVRSTRHGHSDTSARHLLPPQVAVEVIERSGVLDGMTAEAAFRLLDKRDVNIDDEHYSRNDFDEVPYLADPLARRARLEFHGLPGQTGPIILEATFQEKAWPKANGVLLALGPGYKLPRVEREHGHLGIGSRPRVRVDLPPAWRAAVFVQSVPDPADLRTTFLAQYGMDGDPDLVAHPALAPARRIELVHAVEKPLSIPAFTDVKPRRREPTDTFVVLDDRLAVDVKSTGRITCLAAWDEPVDAPARSLTGTSSPPGSERRGGEAFSFPVDAGLQHVLLSEGGVDHNGSVIINRHHLGTTGHRRVEYRLLAETRFTAFFPGSPDRNKRVESPPRVVDIPNAARPPALSIRHVIPVFDWRGDDDALGRNRPWPKRDGRQVLHRERLGRRLRIYVERPCLLSGFQEKVGVVLWPAPLADLSADQVPCLRQVVTQWALDPIWKSASLPDGPFARHFPLAEKPFDGITLLEIPELSQPADPGTDRECSVPAGGIPSRVVIAPHALRFDADADAWYADVEIETGAAYFPFVRLALVRFQPISEPGAHASRLSFADFAQLTPDRYLTLTYVKTPKPAVEISLVGPGYEPRPNDRPEAHVEVRLERPTLHRTDLGWEPIGNAVVLSRVALPDGRTGWGGTLPVPSICPDDARLTIREFERFRQEATAVVRQRLVYADAVPLRL